MPLTRAFALVDSFRCTSFAVLTLRKANVDLYGCDADPPRLFGAGGASPGMNEPTSDAPSRLLRHLRVGSMHRPVAVSSRLSREIPLRVPLIQRDPLAGPSYELPLREGCGR